MTATPQSPARSVGRASCCTGACVLLVLGAMACASAPTAPPGGASATAHVHPEAPRGPVRPPLADPPLQQPRLHLALTQGGLEGLLSAVLPSEGTGEYRLAGARAYSWKRTPVQLQFDNARGAMQVHTDVTAHVEVPGTALDLPLTLDADVQPVLSSDHLLVLQAVHVEVSSDDRRVRLAEWGAGLLKGIATSVTTELQTLKLNLAPMLEGLHHKLAQPVFLPVAGADACFTLDLRGIDAGPTIFAAGFEKDLALTVAPSITAPCTALDRTGKPVRVLRGAAPPLPPPLPPIHNASALPAGPFHLALPIAADYAELDHALAAAFTDGHLFFSKTHPGLSLSEPHVYAVDGALVVTLKLTGALTNSVLHDVEGEIYLTGHPQVKDNFLEVPDLLPTFQTEQALLQLAASWKADELTRTVRQALRFDLTEKLAGIKTTLKDALATEVVLAEGVPPLCTRADVGRMEVTSVEAHDAYVRVLVELTATAAAYLPCPDTVAADAPGEPTDAPRP